MLGWSVVGFIVIVWIITLFRQPTQAVSVLLIFSIIYYDNFIINIQVDLILKVLFLLTVIAVGFKIGFVKKYLFATIPLALCIYFLSIIHAQWTYNYSVLDSITAFASLTIGLLFFCVNFNERQEFQILNIISVLALASLIMGIPLGLLHLVDYFGRDGLALAGASLATNLSFFGTVGIMAAETLKNRTGLTKYRWLEYINFLIVCATLTRGGILASFIVLIPELLEFLKLAINKVKFFMTLFVGLIILIYPVKLLYNEIIQRTFQNGELNTSGRFDAWNHIISITNNKWYGNGYGYLKTMTGDSQLVAFTAAHNEYIRSYFETGLLGSVLLSIILLSIFYWVLKFRSTKKIDYVLMCCIAVLVYSFTDNCITNFRFWIPVMCVLSCIVKQQNSFRLTLKGNKGI